MVRLSDLHNFEKVRNMGNEILFIERFGHPVAQPPGLPDGRNRFNLEQASERFGMSAEALLSLYRAAFAWTEAQPMLRLVGGGE